MKQTLLICSMLCLGALSTLAQDSKSFYKTPYKTRNSGSFHKGDNIISVGYGAPNLSGVNYALPGWYTGNDYSGIGPFYAKFEHGIMDEVGVGLYNATALFANNYRVGNSSFTDRGLALSFGLMGYYHFNKFIPVQKLDVYAGAGAGIRLMSYDYDNSLVADYNNTHVFPVVKVGARYYFTQSFGAYGELGTDQMSVGNIGVSLRF